MAKRVGVLSRGWTVLVNLVLVGVWLLVAAPHAYGADVEPCGGDPTAPMCAGSCPAGLRCVSLVDGALAMAGVGPGPARGTPQDERGASGASSADCGCMQVLCGGTPIGDGQGCCNGVPFVLGMQGCCRGVVVDAGASCDCSGTYAQEAVTQGGSQPDAIVFPAQNCCANNTVFASAGEAIQTGCCLRDGLAVEYSLNSGYDCCPQSGPDFCFGRCEQGQCVTDDCCECSDCRDGPATVCKLPGSTLEFCSAHTTCGSTAESSGAPLDAGIPCDIVCFQNGSTTCPSSQLVVDASCSDGGCATNTAGPSPTATVTATTTETPTATPVPQGGGCSDTAQCVAGLFCADGVCCNTPCDQPLEQCNLPGHAGTCATTAAEAPAMTRTGLLAAAALLVGIAALALGRRLQRG